jgi:hypothetical protein
MTDPAQDPRPHAKPRCVNDMRSGEAEQDQHVRMAAIAPVRVPLGLVILPETALSLWPSALSATGRPLAAMCCWPSAPWVAPEPPGRHPDPGAISGSREGGYGSTLKCGTRRYGWRPSLTVHCGPASGRTLAGASGPAYTCRGWQDGSDGDAGSTRASTNTTVSVPTTSATMSATLTPYTLPIGARVDEHGPRHVCLCVRLCHQRPGSERTIRPIRRI